MIGLGQFDILDDPVVYVVDDDVSVRTALEDLLASVGLAVLTYGSVHEFLSAPIADAPGCLVLDVRMPGQSGLEFQQRMTAMGMTLPVIFITGHGDIAMSVKAMKNGAIEFLTKPFRDQDLLDAIQLGIDRHRLQRKEEIVSAKLRELWQSLTTSEQAVMELVVKGLLNKQIAGQLGVSEITVKVRRGQLMRKMNVKSVTDLVRIWDKLKLRS